MIVHPHVHSQWSALDGFSTPEEIVQRCVEIESPACALTDHGVVSGHLKFAKACSSANIKPIFGVEAYHGLKSQFKPGERDQAHLILLAQNDEGLRNLWRLTNTTSREDHFHNVGRVFWDDLRKHSEGLIATSACPLSLTVKGLLHDDYEPLNLYLDIFRDRFYIELHTYPCDVSFNDRDADREVNMQVINEMLVGVAKERGLPVIVASDAHYANPNQAAYHDAYIAMQTGDTIFTPIDERKMWHPPGALCLLDEQDARKALDYLPEAVVDEALGNSLAIAETVTAQLPEVRRHLPKFKPKECPWLDQDEKEKSAEELFVDKVGEGILTKYGGDDDSAWQRVSDEVNILLDDEIHHYFLMGWDEMMFAKDAGITTGPGRGSSAGSIVAYALDITKIDPLRYGLIFERFWNSGRAEGFPDIDSDFGRQRRAEVIEYLKGRWGKDNVCAIGTTGHMKPKKVIDKLAKGCGIDFKDAEELKKIVGKTPKIDIQGHEQIGWNPALEPGKVHYVKKAVGDEIDKWIKKNPGRRAPFVELCEVCCSRVTQYGVHASGIVISDVPLDSELPAYRRGGKEGVPATMFVMDDVDKRQFVKLDVLGLRTLDVLEHWANLMKKDQDISINWLGLDQEEHPQEMWQLLRDGYTAGIFQVEDGYGRQLCKQVEPRSVDDLSAINALNRPGPIQAGIPDEYIARRKGTKPVTYIHPRLEELVGDLWGTTYGLTLYQEQIIGFFNRIGYTLSESDAVRKILGKKKPEQLMALHDGLAEWKGRGYVEMAAQVGLPTDIADQVWTDLEGFADYSFNLSHSAAYAVIALCTLYAKYWAPAYFYAACLRSFDGTEEKRKTMIPEYINECRRQKINVRPPDIRYAHSRAWASGDSLYFGFSDIKGIGVSGDFIEELRDDIGIQMDLPADLGFYLDIYNAYFIEKQKEKLASGELLKREPTPKQRLNTGKIEALVKAGCWDDTGYREISLTERQKREKEMLGVILTDNSIEVLERHAMDIAQCDSIHEALIPWAEKDRSPDGDINQYEIAGIVTDIKEKRTREGDRPFGIVTLEHDGKVLEGLAPSGSWRRFKQRFPIRTVGKFTVWHYPPGDYGESYLIKSAKVWK